MQLRRAARSVSHWLRASPTRPLTVGLAAMACFATVQANWFYPVLRFGSASLNHLFLLISFTLPWVALGTLLYLPRLWTKVVAILFLLPALAYSAFFAPFTAVETVNTIGRGHDPGFQPISTVPMDGYRVTIFRTNCGATCSYGIAVRQERQLVPGVFLVRELDGFDKYYDAPHRVVGRDSLLVNDRLYVLHSLP
jgi:hypothetical protein